MDTTTLPPQAPQGPPRKAPFPASLVAGVKSSAVASSPSVAGVWLETMPVSISCEYSRLPGLCSLIVATFASEASLPPFMSSLKKWGGTVVHASHSDLHHQKFVVD